MTSIGGFFALELPSTGGSYHSDAIAMCSGRACLRQIVQAIGASRVLLPFYICDSALEPLNTVGVPYSFYSLTPSLEPELSGLDPRRDCVLYVNYFGLKTACAMELAARNGASVIIDDTQAFYQKGYANAWSFNSARKFFGVPDGAYAYGAGLGTFAPSARLEDSRYEHLINRLVGNQDLAYRQFIEHERSVSAELLRPSIFAEQLLAGIDYTRAAQIRRRNFAEVHERLAPLNQLRIDLDLIAEAVPFCYPFLPRIKVPFESLWRRQIFVPQLWPEIEGRTDHGFKWEREISSRLLPLPIDQRYGSEHMERVIEAVLEELA
jgi:hypothetical protein